MKEIKLTKGYVALVDDEDFERINRFNWCVSIKDDRVYARTNKNKSMGMLKGTEMHRMVMNAKDGDIIDHGDRDGLNNQRYNLRRCTKSQNGYNAKKHKHGKLKHKGVSLFPHTTNILANGEKKIGFRAKPYCAEIRVDNKRISLGYYHTEIEAAKAYNEAAIKYHKEFARLNIIEE